MEATAGGNDGWVDAAWLVGWIVASALGRATEHEPTMAAAASPRTQRPTLAVMALSGRIQVNRSCATDDTDSNFPSTDAADTPGVPMADERITCDIG
jgi:hypothetical protein